MQSYGYISCTSIALDSISFLVSDFMELYFEDLVVKENYYFDTWRYLVAKNLIFGAQEQKMLIHVFFSAVYSIKWAHKLSNLLNSTDINFVLNLWKSANRIAKIPFNRKDSVSTNIIINMTKYKESNDLLIIKNLLFGRYCSFKLFDQYRDGNSVLVSKGATAACRFNRVPYQNAIIQREIREL
ncbi:hypothetical protein KUTeg_003379 [Tegillarca granosa]|uniref:Uncharacterized protein n=1 Tax=Tegillarca granosa TaxID=220873 RepID=A0ABQ9FM09_TEGGR|nr:hypothetical protein KUTeg_003379 [Tegillarca granosa]